MKRGAALVSLLLALIACTPVEWTRGDSSPEQLAADMRACRDQAWRESAWSSFAYYGPLGPPLIADPLARRYLGWPYYASPFADPFGDRFFEESRLTSFCMRAKGYELAPVTQ